MTSSDTPTQQDIVSSDNLAAIKNLGLLAEQMLSDPNNLVFPGTITAEKIITKAIDAPKTGYPTGKTPWLRINEGNDSAGRVAIYGGLSIDGTKNTFGGVSIGTWTPPGQGKLEVNKQIYGGHGMESTGKTGYRYWLGSDNKGGRFILSKGNLENKTFEYSGGKVSDRNNILVEEQMGAVAVCDASGPHRYKVVHKSNDITRTVSCDGSGWGAKYKFNVIN